MGSNSSSPPSGSPWVMLKRQNNWHSNYHHGNFLTIILYTTEELKLMDWAALNRVRTKHDRYADKDMQIC